MTSMGSTPATDADTARRIDRRRFLRMAGALSLAAGAMPRRAAGAETAPRRPNVLFVFSDMQRARSMGCYGDPNARTPVLDAFARQGARFDAAISNTPVCCPYRACLMSGQYAHHHGVVSNSVEFRPTAPCVAETFRAAGYETGYSGKWHIIPPRDAKEDRRYGFPAAGTPFGFYQTVRQSSVVTDVALRFIEEKSRGPAPWMLFVSWILPHSPYKAPEGYREHFPKVGLPPNVPDGAAKDYAETNLPDYYGMIESLDDEFARLLRALDRAGVAEDTIVVYTSDHGDMIGSHALEAKRWPYEESARIPFLLRYPRAVPPGTVIADPFGSPDVYPTLAGLAGIASPPGLDGADFAPFVTGRAAKPPRDHVYLAMPYAYVPWPGWRALRTRRHLYARAGGAPWLLFDLEKDPFQMRNLVGDAASRDLVREFDERLAAVMRETGDSWEVKAARGDLDNWTPGGSKQRGQASLGADWPGKAVAGNGGGGGERKRKAKRDGRRADGRNAQP